MKETEKRKATLHNKKTDILVSVIPPQSSSQPCQQPGPNSTSLPAKNKLGLFLITLFEEG